jgi:hypothetical protein
MSDDPEDSSGRSAALAPLKAQLAWLHVYAGRPSLRKVSLALSKEFGGDAPSHSSVRNVLSCEKLPNWQYLEQIVRYLGAAVHRTADGVEAEIVQCRKLWVEAADPAMLRRGSAVIEPVGTLSGGLQSPLRPEDLKAAAVLPLALDDQWMPRGLLRRMAVEGASASDVEQERHELVRAEFIRSLVTAEQVVINRAFLFRNDVITRAYTQERDRAAFAELMRQQVMLIFLFAEDDPLKSHYANAPSAEAWAKIAKTVQVGCVRFEWDDEVRHQEQLRAWTEAFDRRVRLATGINRDRLIEDVGQHDDAEMLERQLDLISRRARPRRRVVQDRTLLYQEFVVRDETEVEARDYDFSKPNAATLKWLFDLVYNSNLATRLGVALAGPADSVHRSVVHNPPVFQNEPADPRFDAAQVRSAIMETIQDALFRRDYHAGALSAFDGITMSDVVTIRASGLWKSYRNAVRALLAEPSFLSHPERGLRAVFQRYDQLIDFVGGRA